MTPAELEIRSIISSDNLHLAEMIRSVFIEYEAPQEGTVYSDPTTDDLFTLFSTKKSLAYTAVYKGTIVGCCGIYPTDALPEGHTELVKFYINKDARGIGIGKLLMSKCENKARDLGYTHIYLESIPAFKKAVGIYERTGYNYLDSPLGNTGHGGCNLWMLKKL